MKRQNDNVAAQMRYRHVTAVCEAVEARIAAHGSEGLGVFCAAYVGESDTVKASILMLIARLCGPAARNAVRDDLAC